MAESSVSQVPTIDRLDKHMFEEQWKKGAKGHGFGISFQASTSGDSLLASPSMPRRLRQLDPANLGIARRPMALMPAGPNVRILQLLRFISTCTERQASVMRFLCDQSILGFSSHEGGPP
jgi:hypothetical protein